MTLFYMLTKIPLKFNGKLFISWSVNVCLPFLDPFRLSHVLPSFRVSFISLHGLSMLTCPSFRQLFLKMSAFYQYLFAFFVTWKQIRFEQTLFYCVLFIYGLFDDTVSNYLASNGTTIKMTNLKGRGRKRSWPNFKVCLGIRETSVSIAVSGPRFETETSRIRNRSANHSAATFGGFSVQVYTFTFLFHFTSRKVCSW
jgi:hypothetical protein